VAVSSCPHPSLRRPVGIGIDFEPVWRSVAPDAARFFLSKPELARLHGPSGGADLLTLWTIKEACFKADPANGVRQLRDYQINDLTAPRGRVRHPDQTEIRYVSLPSELGPITVAVAVPPACAPGASAI
jgi:hypothetical protein